ncbi:MAG: hypothetical protein IKF68_06995 [Erysipelotrichaceae bacterium]|nr:hypothetical protein [Erysipelotrichaceae bacterium]
MRLLLVLPVMSLISFLMAMILLFGSAKGKKKGYNILFFFMTGTGIIFSLIEYILLFNKYGWDEAPLMEHIAVFVLAVVMNSLSCLGKGIVIQRGYGEKNVDYARITGRLNAFDPLCLIVLIAVVLVFK